MQQLPATNCPAIAIGIVPTQGGTALVDTTGTNAPGTLVGATRAASHSAGGLAFGGTAYAALGVLALPAANAAQSLSWWQNAPAITVTQSVISLTNDAASSAVEAGFRSGQVGVWAYGGAFLVAATPPSANAWHHYAYTFDGTTHRLYIDGAQAASSQVAPNAATPTALNLGRWTGGQEYYTGQMDDLRIYGRALTAAEVLALANDQIPPLATGTPTNTPTGTATPTATATPAAPGPVTMHLHYTYDDAGRRIGMLLPDGQQQSWGYDPAGRVNGVIQPGGGSWTVAHNGAGQPTMASVPSGGSQVWGYDLAGRPVSATWLQAGNPTFSQVATLDPAGQRTGLADSWGTVTYGYDRAGRLTSAGYPDGSTEADSYDPAGNRTTITATTPLSGTVATTNTYDAADQLSTAATTGGPQPGTTTYGYDGNGNQTGSSGPAGTTSNTFNDLNQLTHIVGPGTNLTLLYDGQGDRLRSYERGTPTWALRNEAQDLAGGLSALVWDGTADYAYLSPGDGSAPLSSYTPATSRATYLATDLLGSVRLATDPSGATIGAGAYDAWGVARPYAGGSGATQLAGLQGVAPFGYAGQQRDAGPGTYAMRARRYDPTQGRFQSQDPLAYSPQVPVTINPYEYAGNMPTGVTDSSGQGWVQQPLGSHDDRHEAAIQARIRTQMHGTPGTGPANLTTEYNVPVYLTHCNQPLQVYNAGIVSLSPDHTKGYFWDIEHVQAYTGHPGAAAIASGIRTHLALPLLAGTFIDWRGDCPYNRVGNAFGGGGCAAAQRIRVAGVEPGPDYAQFFHLGPTYRVRSRGEDLTAHPVESIDSPPAMLLTWAEPGQPGLVLYDSFPTGSRCSMAEAGGFVGVLACYYRTFEIGPALAVQAAAAHHEGLWAMLTDPGQLFMLLLPHVHGAVDAATGRGDGGQGDGAVSGDLLALHDESGGATLVEDLAAARHAEERTRDCSTCFAAGTRVALPEGSRAIERLKVGDTVLSEDPKAGTVEPERVLAVLDDGVKPLIALDLSDGSSIRVTSNHAFWVDGGPALDHAGWLQAGQLRPGDRLRTADGRGATVRALHWNQGDAEVYTLTVDRDHTFFVGAAGVLVHNAFPCPFKPDLRGQIIYPRDPLVQKKYPLGVRVSKDGYPVFTPYARMSVHIQMRGNRGYGPDGDFGNANEAAGLPRNWKSPNWTWHHSEDGRTMELVPRDLHSETYHYGGVYVVKQTGGKP